MKPDEKAIRIVDDSYVEVEGDRLPFTTYILPVVRNKKTHRLGIHARSGNGGFFYMRPIRKDGSLGRSQEHWTRETKWMLVGKVSRHVAYRTVTREPSCISRLFGAQPKDVNEPILEWTDTLKIFPESEWSDVLFLHDFLQKHKNS